MIKWHEPLDEEKLGGEAMNYVENEESVGDMYLDRLYAFEAGYRKAMEK